MGFVEALIGDDESGCGTDENRFAKATRIGGEQGGGYEPMSKARGMRRRARLSLGVVLMRNATAVISKGEAKRRADG